ncbi:MAG: S-methyl-5-thioribose-1-phosphate isomerase, partial [Candidatus Neomarinimicrobiota bacterium]
YHQIPFYVAAPSSSIDPSISSGKTIRIEERSGVEVREVFGRPIAPADCPAISPAFDVTPADLISAIITEQKIFRAPFNFTE